MTINIHNTYSSYIIPKMIYNTYSSYLLSNDKICCWAFTRSSSLLISLNFAATNLPNNSKSGLTFSSSDDCHALLCITVLIAFLWICNFWTLFGSSLFDAVLLLCAVFDGSFVCFIGNFFYEKYKVNINYKIKTHIVYYSKK